MTYTINPQSAQDSIVAELERLYPHVPIIPDGLMDQDDDKIKRNLDNSIKPFVVLWFAPTRRSYKGRSMAFEKLDPYGSGVDLVVVARSGTEARTLINDMSDRLVGFNVADGGRIHKGSALWSTARSIEISERPTRFVTTDRFEFAISSRKVL